MGYILITGGSGYLGSRIADKLTGRPIIRWGRKQGDLTSPDPFAGIDPDSVEEIIHAAAVIRFNVDAATAQKVNIEGTEKALNFAQRCRKLKRFAFLSSVYSAGLRSGVVEEKPLDDSAGFANHYERSKWESERRLLESRLPWTIFRIATVIADDASGTVTQQNAVHNTLRLLFYGLISVLPGRPETPVYLVTGDFAADAVIRLTATHTVYHVTHTRAEALTLGGLIDLAFERFGLEGDFRARRILRPLFTDQKGFEILAGGVGAFGGGVVNQAIGSVTPFAPQLYVDKDIRVSPALGPRPDMRQVLNNCCDYLVRTRWGSRA